MEAAMADRGGGSMFQGLRRMGGDFLFSIVLMVVLLVTGDIYLATATGLVIGLGQVVWLKARRRPVDPMQWAALALIAVLGTATLVLHDPRYVVAKPSIFMAGFGAVMLRPGWMLRYLPPGLLERSPRWLFVAWGYVWAAGFFAIAAANLVVARCAGLKAWSAFSSIAPWVVIALLMVLPRIIFPPIVRLWARRSAA
jgi:intracellular septation protein A